MAGRSTCAGHLAEDVLILLLVTVTACRLFELFHSGDRDADDCDKF